MNKCLYFVPTELGWCSVNCADCDKSKCKHCVWGTRISKKLIFCMFPECVKEGESLMPTKPKRPCSYPGCPELTLDRYCDKHQKQVTKEYDRRRGSAASRGYDHRWVKARKRYLAEHPLCVECQKIGKLTPANVIDHIVAHKGDRVKFWNESNWQSLCKRCHDSKTAREDGRWG